MERRIDLWPIDGALSITRTSDGPRLHRLLRLWPGPPALAIRKRTGPCGGRMRPGIEGVPWYQAKWKLIATNEPARAEVRPGEPLRWSRLRRPGIAGNPIRTPRLRS